jgi:3-deoxy-D-arabino-heptulosonate 7-phosphate (DAHP) synthase
MIEIHNDAENALTDKQQQISTNELEELIKKDS